MKKLLLIATILFVAVFTTACINNIAVQELNNNAESYVNKGQYDEAIKRLESSMDLDPTIIETHYNLGIAYTHENKYEKAINEFKKVIKLDSKFKDVYYSLATAENNYAITLENDVISLNDDNSTKQNDFIKKSDFIKQLYTSAIKHYAKYLSLNPNAKEKSQIEKQITSLNSKIK